VSVLAWLCVCLCAWVCRRRKIPLYFFTQFFSAFFRAPTPLPASLGQCWRFACCFCCFCCCCWQVAALPASQHLNSASRDADCDAAARRLCNQKLFSLCALDIFSVFLPCPFFVVFFFFFLLSLSCWRCCCCGRCFFSKLPLGCVCVCVGRRRPLVRQAHTHTAH